MGRTERTHFRDKRSRAAAYAPRRQGDLQDAEQHRFDVLLIGNRDSLCCDAADMESFLSVLNSFNIHIFAGGQGSWVEPNGRHYAPLPRLPWQEDDVAEVPQ